MPKGVRGREKEQAQDQAIGSGAGCILSLTRNRRSILRGRGEGGMSYDFKNIPPATACFAKLPLQISVILAFRESPGKGNQSGITGPQCAKALITRGITLQKAAPVSTPPPSGRVPAPPPTTRPEVIVISESQVALLVLLAILLVAAEFKLSPLSIVNYLGTFFLWEGELPAHCLVFSWGISSY